MSSRRGDGVVLDSTRNQLNESQRIGASENYIRWRRRTIGHCCASVCKHNRTLIRRSERVIAAVNRGRDARDAIFGSRRTLVIKSDDISLRVRSDHDDVAYRTRTRAPFEYVARDAADRRQRRHSLHILGERLKSGCIARRMPGEDSIGIAKRYDVVDG